MHEYLAVLGTKYTKTWDKPFLVISNSAVSAFQINKLIENLAKLMRLFLCRP